LLVDRGEGPFPPDVTAWDVSKLIKEKYCYMTADIQKEIVRYDDNKGFSHWNRFEVHHNTNPTFSVEMGYEKFLGPEIYFSPQMVTSEPVPTLPKMIYDVIQNCSIELHCPLFENIVLGGGGAWFKDMARKLQRDIGIEYDKWYPNNKRKKIVVHPPFTKNPVCWGANLLASTPEYRGAVLTKQLYDEVGPSCCDKFLYAWTRNASDDQICPSPMKDPKVHLPSQKQDMLPKKKEKQEGGMWKLPNHTSIKEKEKKVAPKGNNAVTQNKQPQHYVPQMQKNENPNSDTEFKQLQKTRKEKLESLLRSIDPICLIHINNFLSESIYAEDIAELSEQDLKELKISMGPRKKILSHIRKIKNKQHPEKQESTSVSSSCLPFSDLQNLHPCGSGSFGSVFSASFHGIKVAVKIPNKTAQEQYVKFLKEANLMMKVQGHPNLVKLHGICLDPFAIVMEFLDKGSLLEYLTHNPNQTLGNILAWILQISEGMKHLHHCQVVHQDLALRNVMIGTDIVAKVGDFGLSKSVVFSSQSEKSCTLTLSKQSLPILWMPPECWEYHERKGQKGLRIAYSADVWSFGITIWEMFALEKPYPGFENVLKIKEQINKGVVPLFKPSDCPDNLWTVIMQCINIHPSNRPRFTSLVNILKDLVQSLSSLHLQPLICGVQNLVHTSHPHFVGNTLNTTTTDSDHYIPSSYKTFLKQENNTTTTDSDHYIPSSYKTFLKQENNKQHVPSTNTPIQYENVKINQNQIHHENVGPNQNNTPNHNDIVYENIRGNNTNSNIRVPRNTNRGRLRNGRRDMRGRGMTGRMTRSPTRTGGRMPSNFVGLRNVRGVRRASNNCRRFSSNTPRG